MLELVARSLRCDLCETGRPVDNVYAHTVSHLVKRFIRSHSVTNGFINCLSRTVCLAHRLPSSVSLPIAARVTECETV